MLFDMCKNNSRKFIIVIILSNVMLLNYSLVIGLFHFIFVAVQKRKNMGCAYSFKLHIFVFFSLPI